VRGTTGKFLTKAERALAAAKDLLQSGYPDFAAARAYYAMLYVATALLNEKGLRFRKHGAVHGAFGEYFVKTGEFDVKYHRWLLAGFDKRIAGDYGVDAVITQDDAESMINQAHEFLRQARRYSGGT